MICGRIIHTADTTTWTQYDPDYYDDQYDYDDSGDIDIDDLDRALEQLNGVSERSTAFTVYSPAVSISE